MGRAADELRLGARIFTYKDYLIVYRRMAYGIAVLRVSHGARDLTLMDFPPAPPAHDVSEPQLQYCHSHVGAGVSLNYSEAL
jgi:hypothetical protein